MATFFRLILIAVTLTFVVLKVESATDQQFQVRKTNHDFDAFIYLVGSPQNSDWSVYYFTMVIYQNFVHIVKVSVQTTTEKVLTDNHHTKYLRCYGPVRIVSTSDRISTVGSLRHVRVGQLYDRSKILYKILCQ